MGVLRGCKKPYLNALPLLQPMNGPKGRYVTIFAEEQGQAKV